MALISVGATSSKLTAITPDPSAMTWGLQDVSSSDAGRTQDGYMHKMRVTQKRKLSLTWTLLTAAQTAAILAAFNNEYFYVSYWDAMDNQQETRQFYAGDRTAPVKWFLDSKGKRYETLTFDIIER